MARHAAVPVGGVRRRMRAWRDAAGSLYVTAAVVFVAGAVGALVLFCWLVYMLAVALVLGVGL